MNDLINGGFELVGAGLCWLNVRRLLRDKKLEGVVWQVQGFFTAWGLWNLWYYPALGQWLSFVGGIVLVIGNGTWVVLAVWYAGVLGRWWDWCLQWCWFALGGDQWKREQEAPRPMVPSAGNEAFPLLGPVAEHPWPPLPGPRQVCLFVGGPLDGEKLAIEAYHVEVGRVIEITLPDKESDYAMHTWGVFEFVSKERA